MTSPFDKAVADRLANISSTMAEAQRVQAEQGEQLDAANGVCRCVRCCRRLVYNSIILPAHSSYRQCEHDSGKCKHSEHVADIHAVLVRTW